MIRRFGTIGHYSPGIDGLALATAMIMASRHQRSAPPPTAKQIKEREVRTERQQWNDEVERRKAEKKRSKTKDSND